MQLSLGAARYACAVVGLWLATSVNAGTQLLSQHATYTVIGGGWVYEGQIQPESMLGQRKRG